MKVFVPPTPAPQIVEPPVDQIVAPGGSATFSVLASGDHLDYQWQAAQATMRRRTLPTFPA